MAILTSTSGIFSFLTAFALKDASDLLPLSRTSRFFKKSINPENDGLSTLP